jgi:CBS-domain-containing membrane protein
MIGTRSVHPPACATTLIVSLGLLSTPTEGTIIVGAVTILYVLGAASSWLRFTS